jgi:hypothetical protein
MFKGLQTLGRGGQDPRRYLLPEGLAQGLHGFLDADGLTGSAGGQAEHDGAPVFGMGFSGQPPLGFQAVKHACEGRSLVGECLVHCVDRAGARLGQEREDVRFRLIHIQWGFPGVEEKAYPVGGAVELEDEVKNHVPYPYTTNP